MKHSFTLFAFIATAAAQISPDKLAADNAAVTPLEDFTDIVRPVALALATINSSVIALDAAAVAFAGPADVAALNSSANDVLATLADQSGIIAALAPLPEDLGALLPLLSSLDSLADYVNITAFDIIQKRDPLVAACAGPLVLEQANNLNTSTADFAAIVISQLPVDVQPIPANNLIPVFAALNSAVSAFADQTTLPDSCSSTTTTTTTESSTSTSTTATSTGSTTTTTTSSSSSCTSTTTGSVYPTGFSVYPTGGSVYPTSASVYPTGGSKNCYRRRHRARVVDREI